MADPVLIKIAYAFAVVIVYGLLRWRLMRATHEYRVQAGCEADRWAENPKVEPRIRASLSGLADMAYRPLTPWALLVGLIVAMFSPLGKFGDLRISDDEEVAREIVKLKLTLFFALITTSPLAFFFAAVILAIGLLARGSVSTIRDCASMAGDRFFSDGDTGLERA